MQLKLAILSLPEGVKPSISDRDFVIATLVPPTVEVETKTEEEATDVEKLIKLIG